MAFDEGFDVLHHNAGSVVAETGGAASGIAVIRSASATGMLLSRN
jgi:hypothetical protein